MKHEIIKEYLLYMQVCSEGTFDDALDFVRNHNPSGTTNNWQKDEREEVKPVKCKDIPGRTHYLFVT